MDKKIYCKSWDKELWDKEGVLRCIEKWLGLPSGWWVPPTGVGTDRKEMGKKEGCIVGSAELLEFVVTETARLNDAIIALGTQHTKEDV